MIIPFPKDKCPPTEQLRKLAQRPEKLSLEVRGKLEEHLQKCNVCLTKVESYSVSQERFDTISLQKTILGVGAFLSLMLGVVLLVVWQTRPEVRPMELARLQGQVATSMGSPGARVEAPFVFVATSQIELLFRPQAEEGNGRVKTVEVFTGGFSGEMKRVSAKVERRGSSKYPVVRIRGLAGEWFSEEGTKRIVVRFAEEIFEGEMVGREELCAGALCTERHIYFESD